MSAETAYLLPTFQFAITLTQVSGRPSTEPLELLQTDGGFAECSGLELEADVREYLEGGRNDGVVRRVGRVKLVPIVLKRGMFSASRTEPANRALWAWLTQMVGGELPVRRYDGRIDLFDTSGRNTLATWTFERGLPQKVTGPTLNAKTGEVAIEELRIVHEGLRMEMPS